MLLLLLAVPPVAAAPPNVQASLGLLVPIPVQELTLDTSALTGAGNPTDVLAPRCSETHFARSERLQSFTFREGREEAGCLGVRYNLTLPAGSDSFDLVFRANRTVTQASSAGQPPFMVQEVRLLVDGVTLQPHDVFKPTDPSQPAYEKVLSFQVPAEPSRLQLEWFFADQGRSQLGGPLRLESFSASVLEPAIHVRDVPLPAPVVDSAGARFGEADRTHAAYEVKTSVPPAYHDAARAGTATLRIRLDLNGTLRLERVLGPNDESIEAPYRVDNVPSGGTAHFIEVPAETLQRLGPGPYRVLVVVEEPLRPNAAFEFLSYAILIAPAAALAVAWIGLRRTELHAGEEE